MPESITIGTSRQLLLDDLFFDRRDGIELVMHQPSVREPALESDRSWESGGVHYSSVLKDGDSYRMWYRADTGGDPTSPVDSESWICYAESSDGIAWEKPSLGIVSSVEGGGNNILFPDKVSGINPSVIIDPSAAPDRRYKMITRGSKPTNVLGYVSSDGIGWEPVPSNPLLSEPGPFDSQNVLAYDDEKGRYVIFCRGVDANRSGSFKGGIRAVRRSESEDFSTWSDLEQVLTGDASDPEDLHIYTNAAFRYARAQRAWMMFPMILYVDREVDANRLRGLSDVQFVTSRDGVVWDRRFRRPFLSPDRDPRNWVDRNPVMGIGMVETASDELSLYFSELLRCDDSRFTRCTIRMDGFASARGPYDRWGEFTTPVLNSEGRSLELNFRTTGGGRLRVEIQDATGRALPGASLDECNEMFGDHIDHRVTWGLTDRFDLAGAGCRLRFQLRDADLFSFRLTDED